MIYLAYGMSDTELTLYENWSKAHVDCVRQAVVSTFGAICGAEPTFKGLCESSTHCDGVMAIISLVGDIDWSVTLCLNKQTATSLVLRFAGFEVPFDSPDMGDAVGELVNVLCGDVVAFLDATGIKSNMSLPTVASGSDMAVLVQGGVSSIRLQYACLDGDFTVGLAAQKNQ